MRFIETPLRGAYVVELEPFTDERGFFARTWCRDEFAQHGLNHDVVQCSVSLNHRKGTLRGMHFQARPYEETKLVRCTAGAIYDVILDLRPNSPTFKKWYAVELTAANRKMVFVPIGFAHGFQTTEDDTEIFYQISQAYRPESARGVRWNDPAFGIKWPLDVQVISDRDNSYSNFFA